eukprot:3357565-Pyramimonas_sp.AAC.1
MGLACAFLDRLDGQKVAYSDLWATPVSEPAPQNFAEIVRSIVGRRWQGAVREVKAEQSIGFSSRHFLVVARLAVEIPNIFAKPA